MHYRIKSPLRSFKEPAGQGLYRYTTRREMGVRYHLCKNSARLALSDSSYGSIRPENHRLVYERHTGSKSNGDSSTANGS